MGTHTQSIVCIGQSCFSDAGERLLRASAVARRIDRTPRMVRYLAERGILPGFKRGKLWFFKEPDVLSYLRERERYIYVQ